MVWVLAEFSSIEICNKNVLMIGVIKSKHEWTEATQILGREIQKKIFDQKIKK